MSKNRPLQIGAAVLFTLGLLVCTGLSRRESTHHHRPRRAHVEATASVTEADMENMAAAQDVLHEIVQTHPEPAIREDLNRLIATGVVLLNFQELEILENNQSIATAMLMNIEGELRIVLSINASLLLDPNTPRTMKQLVVYHEYIHIEQQMTHREPSWLMIGMDTRMMSEDDVRTYFRAEMEAYVAECDLAIRLHATDVFDLCQVYADGGVQDMRIAYSRILAGAPAYAPVSEMVLRVGREPN